MVTPGVKPTSSELGEPLGASECTAYRSRAMRGSYLAEDRPDIRYACREAARLMKAPSTVGMELLKRTARFLVSHPRLAHRMEKQPPVIHGDGLSDANHAGCLRDRLSTGCTSLMHGGHMVKFSTGIQDRPDLSTAETEWYGLV